MSEKTRRENERNKNAVSSAKSPEAADDLEKTALVQRSTSKGGRGPQRVDEEHEHAEWELRQFERSVYVSTIEEEDLSNIFGSDWRIQRPTTMDFSSRQFKIESLGSRGRGLLSKSLNKSRLTCINVSENRLHDIDGLNRANGFQALTIIIARSNLIWQVEPDLPKLLELNLSHNQLTALPRFHLCPMLECLVFSHNHLTGSFDSLQSLSRLKRLDLAYNQYNLKPSELQRSLRALSYTIQNLRLYNNPFVACFNEYQVFVVSMLPGLKVLDDLTLTQSLRREIKEWPVHLYQLDCYDDLFKKRQKQIQQEQLQVDNTDDEKNQTSFPRLKFVINRLEDILEDSSVLHTNVKYVRDMAMRRARCTMSDDVKYDVEEVFWFEVDTTHPEVIVNQVLELIISIMERHDSIRVELIETLGFFSLVVKHKLGEKCMEYLGKMMATSEVYRVEVSRTLRTVVIPTLKALGWREDRKKYTQTITLGLVSLLRNKAIRVYVAEAMEDVVPMLFTMVVKSPLVTDVALEVKLLAYSTKISDNLKLVSDLNSLADTCIVSIDNRSIQEHDTLRDLWLDVLRLGENLARYGSDDVVTKFIKAGMHVKVISRGKSIVELGNVLVNPKDARTLSVVLSFVTALMDRRIDVLRECCGSFHLIETLVLILKEPTIDPLVLTDSARCLHVALRDPATFSKHIVFVITELGKLVPLLQLLGGKRYPDLFKRSLRHALNKDKPSADDEKKMSEQCEAPINHHRCYVANEAILACIGLIAFFADEEGHAEEDDFSADQRAIVNDALDKSQREKVLLKLLVMDSDEIKHAVMKCIGKVALDQIQMEEMGLIVKRLAMTENISAGQMEETLALVVIQLQRLAGSDSEAGVIFRQNFAAVAIAEAYEVLNRNAQRSTYGGEEEEQQKLRLSNAIISFFITCCKFPTLRTHFRNHNVQERFPEILKYEEELHSPLAADVSLEYCWTGRCLETLIACVTGPRALDRSKKVALRILSRVADILEGCTDGLLEEKTGEDGVSRWIGTSVQEVAQRESTMWDQKTIERKIGFLDNQEQALRKQDTDILIAGSNVKNLIHFVRKANAADKLRKYNDQIALAQEKNITIKADCDKKKEEIEREDLEQKAKDKEKELNMEEWEKPLNQYDLVTGRTAMMMAIQRCEDPDDGEAYTLFAQKHQDFQWNHQLYEDEKCTYVSESYGVAAVLRVIHSLIVVPPTDTSYETIITDLRQVSIPLEILALLEDVPCLACHTAAKFLRLLSHVLDISKCSMEKAPLPLSLLYVFSVYAKKISLPLLASLRFVRDAPLGSAEQILCAEMARFLSALINVIPHFSFSDNEEAQRLGVATCMDWLVPPVIVRLLVAVVTYDLQIDHGGGLRGSINATFVKQAYFKTGTKDYAADCIAKLIARCPHHKYDILEVFSVSSVFLHMTVRPSFLGGLLTAIDMGTYTQHVESWIRGLSDNPSEQVVHMSLAEIKLSALQPWTLCLVCLTTHMAYLLLPSDQQPPYQFREHGTRWEPSWEKNFPRDPKLIWKRRYRDMESIYRVYGTQCMAIAWKEESQVQHPGNVAANAKQPHSIFIFHRSNDCEVSMQCCFHRGGRRSYVANCPSTRKEVLGKAGNQQVLACTVATYAASESGGGMDSMFKQLTNNSAEGSSIPHLFVLTKQKILQFSIDLTAWQLPEEGADVAFDADDFRPMASNGKDEDIRLQSNSPGNVDRRQKTQRQKTEKNGLTFTCIKETDLNLQEVAFEVTQEPILAIDCGEKLRIKFYDDSGREQWRLALAYVLKDMKHTWERSIQHDETERKGYVHGR